MSVLLPKIYEETKTAKPKEAPITPIMESEEPKSLAKFGRKSQAAHIA